MKQIIPGSFLTSVLLTGAMSLTACGGSSGDPSAQSAGSQTDSGEQAGMVLGDDSGGDSGGDSGDSALQCDGTPFDHAELLFTEIDRQWLCSVTSSQLSGNDGVYFGRNGTASFARFGDVYWNRNSAAAEINVASPFIVPFVMRNISSSNTTMQFNLVDETSAEQLYECVLVQRDDIS